MKNSLLLSVNIGILLSYIFTYYCHDKIIDYSDDLTCTLRKKYEKDQKRKDDSLRYRYSVSNSN